ncbi:MAG: hypothetical protein AB1611_02350 [bacterium]
MSTTGKVKPSSILIIFWHGLGDFILATPALREFYRHNPGCRLGIAVRQMVHDSGILDRCPYFDMVHVIPEVEDREHYRKKLEKYLQAGNMIRREHGYEKLVCIKHRPAWRYGIHKIQRTANELGVGPITDTRTELYLSDQDRSQARSWLQEHGYEENNYIFLHRQTANPVKDMPEDVAARVLLQLPPLPVIEVGKTYSIHDRHINFSFALLEKARLIVVADSVFLHAANALGKDIAIAYFSLMPGIIDEVRPLDVKCRSIESYSGSFILLRKINWICQRILFEAFFKPLMIIRKKATP